MQSCPRLPYWQTHANKKYDDFDGASVEILGMDTGLIHDTSGYYEFVTVNGCTNAADLLSKYMGTQAFPADLPLPEHCNDVAPEAPSAFSDGGLPDNPQVGILSFGIIWINRIMSDATSFEQEICYG